MLVDYYKLNIHEKINQKAYWVNTLGTNNLPMIFKALSRSRIVNVETSFHWWGMYVDITAAKITLPRAIAVEVQMPSYWPASID